MDVSVVAAVGSFVVSERVLKPKATALFVLGCILAYDLTTKTHDISSLRVYRGPSLLAFTLMMCAYSLRTWRRNGVACDELLFLPGTLHGHEHGVEGPLIEMPAHPTPTPPPPPIESSPEPVQREADMAAGGFSTSSSSSAATNNFRHRRTHSEEDWPTAAEEGEACVEASAEAKGADGNREGKDVDGLLLAGDEHAERDWDVSENDGDEAVQSLLHRSNAENGDNNNNNNNNNNSTGENGEASGPVQRWRENHPRLALLGTFFFFRSSASSTQNAAYAPSGPSVFGAGLDLSMPVLFNFHLFIEAYNHIQAPDASEAPAKILPIIFLSVLIVRTVVPPGRRMRFWGTLKFTFTAPLHRMRFRDEFIGDVLTSWVRPGQDLFFALSYYLTVIWGTITGKYGLTQSGLILEESWLLHNVIMPSFAILPLWLKYLQTLRQAYDTNKRWPYQANSLKYLSATLVIIYGIMHPEKRTTTAYVMSFIFAILYQIWWDVVMDWELFEIQRDIQLVEAEQDSWCARISSLRPNSHILLNLQMYLVQPILNQYQRIRTSVPSIPSLGQIQLRQKRLYKTESFYWKIFAYNFLTRFTWMLCFIPAYHVSRSRTVLTSTSDVNSYWGVILPVAEIVRRTLWGFLFLEKETIKLMEADSKYSQASSSPPTDGDADGNNNNDDDDDDEDHDDDSKFGERSFRTQLLPTWLDNQQQVAHNAATSRSKQRDKFVRQLFVIELYGWAGAFVILGVIVAS